MPLSDADKIVNLEDLAAFKAKMDESVLHKMGTEIVSGEKVFSGIQTTAAGNETALIVVKDATLVKGETPATNHYLSLGFIDSTGDSYAQDTASRLAVVEYKSPSEADPAGYTQMVAMGFNGGGSVRLQVGHDKDGIRYATAPSTSEDRTNGTDIVTRGYMEASEWNWQKTKKAGAVTFKPVPESDLEPIVDFIFTETPPAEGEKGLENPSTITGVSSVKVTKCGTQLLPVINPGSTSSGSFGDVSITKNGDGTYTFSGTATAKANTSGQNRAHWYLLDLGFPKGTYVAGYKEPTAKMQLIVSQAKNGVTSYPTATGASPLTFVIDDSTTAINVFFQCVNNTAYDETVTPVITLLNDTKLADSYAGIDYTIQLGDTYYGGSLDVATGVMTVTYAKVEFDGTGVSWSTRTKTGSTAFYVSNGLFPGRKLGNNTPGACSHFNKIADSSIGTVAFGFFSNSIGGYFNYPGEDVSVDTWNAFLAAQNAAGTPLTVVYELETPVTVQLTPTQIRSLPALDKYEPRINTVYTDQEAVQVGYQRYVDEDNLVHRMGDEFVAGAKTFAQGPFGTTSTLAGSAVSLADGCVFTKTVSANTSFTITGVPSGKAATFNLILTNGGSYTVTWPASVKWADGTAPDLTASGIDVLTFLTPDGGATWYGTVALSGVAA